MADARFEDGEAGPLRLLARAAGDVAVLASLCQDAVFLASDLTFERKPRRFGLLMNRFRWEEGGRVGARPERVRSLLVVEGVLGVKTQGALPRDAQTVLSLLSLEWRGEGDAEGLAGRLILQLAGDSAIALDLEALDVSLRDVTRPYYAVSGKVPQHPDLDG